MAPTGSSIFNLSKATILKTTITPPMAPINVDSKGVGSAGSAVIATSPASAPFRHIVRSVLPKSSLAVIMAAMSPPEAAALVFRNTFATSLATPIPPSFSVDPPLNPNHPIHRIKVPRVASGRLAPGIAFMAPDSWYLPVRGPSNRTPARAAAAPARCTMPEPA